MLLSVIVPVYNMASEDKLVHCMESLVSQTVTDMEIIAVDDASSDSSVEILRKYEKKFPDKVKVIVNEQNLRQGGAKNKGLDVAQGKWIGFIDSDDWITPDFYEKLIKKADKTGADMVGCNYTLVDHYTFEPGIIAQNNTLDQTGELDREKHGKLIMRSGSMVIKIYRSDVIRENNLRFPEKRLYEDNFAGPLWSMYFKHFEMVDEPLYFYFQHESSTVHTFDFGRIEDRMYVMRLLIEETKNRKLDNSDKTLFDEYKEFIEFRFTELFYVITLFSYMQSVKKVSFKFIRNLRKETLSYFPEFMNNKYYMELVNPDQRKFISYQLKNDLLFLIIYRIKAFYRNMKKSLIK